jgi:hypothetical protein
MRNRTKVVMGAMTAALLLSIAVSAASANRLASSETRFRQYFSALAFGPEQANGGNVTCPVTLEGTFHSRTISKVLESLVGYVTSALVGNEQCRNGEATVFKETLPWHIRYGGFAGALPGITSVTLRLVLSRFRIHSNSLGTTCTSTTSSGSPAIGISTVTSGTITLLSTLRTARIPTGFECLFVSGSFIGSSEVFAGTSGTTRITVTLVQ